MSRQSKNARKLAKAREITALHLKGEKAAAKTTPLHGKRWTYRQNPEVAKRVAEQIKATSAPTEKTSGKKILEGAGGASKPAKGTGKAASQGKAL